MITSFKPFSIFLFILLYPGNIFSQENSGEVQDALILEKFFRTVSKNTLDSSMIHAALFFLNTPYVANTLEINEEEKLVVNLREMDCTTFVENCFALARALQDPHPDLPLFKRELQQIRYRNGIIGEYTSRLHYMSDWIYDNAEKGILENITYALGGRRLSLNVNFMSVNYKKYPRLADDPEEVQRIEALEKAISTRKNYYYIPKQEIAEHQSLIKNGDIICFTTAIPGLDISHLGIAYWRQGRLTFIHASTSAKKVIINPESLTDYCRTIKNNTGIIVLRPMSVKNT
jgi:cell wall-associated NlpC family hydrolase